MTDHLDTTNADHTAPPLRLRFKAFVSGNRLFVVGCAIFAVILFAAIFAPLTAPYSPNEIQMGQRLLPPSWEHIAGTDRFGRDIMSRIIYGARTSLAIGLLVTLIAFLIGAPIGLVSGYFGGWVDTALMRVSDIFLAFPPLLLPIAITASLGPGLVNAMFALAISWFPWYARIMRGAVVRVRKELYIDAARTMGVSDVTIMVRHVLPNSMTPTIVQGSMDFGYAILAAASLSFIGLGIRPPGIEWGLMAATARVQFLTSYWTALAPGVAIFVTVLAVNLIGDGLRDILDPKHGEQS